MGTLNVGLGVEVDQHIAPEDQVEEPERRVLIVVQIEALETHQRTNLESGFHLTPWTRGPASVQRSSHDITQDLDNLFGALSHRVGGTVHFLESVGVFRQVQND